eukprot:804754-Rhodomonas_salina.1
MWKECGKSVGSVRDESGKSVQVCGKRAGRAWQALAGAWGRVRKECEQIVGRAWEECRKLERGREGGGTRGQYFRSEGEWMLRWGAKGEDRGERSEVAGRLGR